jgi:single-strand DNA-binding protein
MANFNFNKVILGGRLTAEPELRQTTSGTFVTSFSIAVNRRMSKTNEVDFINCQAWGSTAEFICKFFRKGSSICVTGQIQVRSWKDNQGNNRYATEVVVDEANFVDSKSDNAAYQAESAPSFNESAPEFEEITGDQDLPF